MRYFTPITNDSNFLESSFDELFEPMFLRRNKNFELTSTMKTDIQELENNYLIEIDMPGYEKENINLSLEDGYLTVSGTIKKDTKEEEKNNFIKRERFVGTCSRKFYVGNLTENSIEASFKNGVLAINVPKEAPKPDKKQITIR